MSLRPPAKFTIRYIGTSTATTGNASPWPQSSGSPVPLQVPQSIGSDLRLMGVLFEAAADGLVFVAIPAEVPDTTTLSNLNLTAPGIGYSEVVSGPSFLEKIVATIDPSTTAFPFQLWYGPLGPGGR